jgi:hypothetical protein
LGKTEPAIFRRNFDAKRPEPGQLADHIRRNFPGAIDFVRVDIVVQESFEGLQERVPLVPVLQALRWKAWGGLKEPMNRSLAKVSANWSRSVNREARWRSTFPGIDQRGGLVDAAWEVALRGGW